MDVGKMNVRYYIVAGMWDRYVVVAGSKKRLGVEY
jgi:hypothetical protein